MKKKLLNRRKINILNLNFYLFIFLLFIFCFLIINFDKLSIFSKNIFQKFSDNYGYNFSQIEIENLKYLNQDEIKEYFNPYFGNSILTLPLNRIAKTVQENIWIKNLTIKSNYKDALKVMIFEEEPFLIYNNENQEILFSKNLVSLQILPKDHIYKNLISIYGLNSMNNVKNLIYNIDSDFYKNIKSATYISNRRWNLELKNFILLKMSDINFKKSLENYNKIYENFSNRDLRNIESIDLRIQNQAIIKYRNIADD